MSNEPEQERSPSDRPTGGSVLNRLVNQAGFWMAVFSLAGLVMLTVAGPIVQKRMSRRSIPASEMTQPVTTATGGISAVSNQEDTGRSSQSASAYSLDGLRWTLAVFFLLGVFWTCLSMFKLRIESSGI